MAEFAACKWWCTRVFYHFYLARGNRELCEWENVPMRVKLFVGAALVALVGVFVSGPAPAPAAATSSIYKTLEGMKENTVLYVGINEGEEIAALSGSADRGKGAREVVPAAQQQGPEEQYTLFAPTNAAFKELDDATTKKLATGKAAVKQLVRAHIVKGRLTDDDLKKLNGKEVRTLQGGALKVEEAKDGLRVGGVKIATANVLCSNGVIHVIDAVLPLAKE